MILLLPFFLATSLPAGACQAIDSESVLARDVVPLVPAFAQLPQDFLLGYLPASGAHRIFKGADLERIARNRGLDFAGLEDICLMRRTFIPEPAQIRAAMEKTLGIDGVKIEIVSSSQQPAPTGEIVFPRTGVQRPSGDEITWHGYVRYSEAAKFPIWARARISATMNRVIPAMNLPAGKLIQKSQIRVESCEDSPFNDAIARDLDEVTGLMAKATLPSGAPIRKSQIERPMDVARGDLVRVELFEGLAHLSLEARAETSGMKGATITVRNLSSGRDFRAKVTGKDQVLVGGPAE